MYKFPVFLLGISLTRSEAYVLFSISWRDVLEGRNKYPFDS